MPKKSPATHGVLKDVLTTAAVAVLLSAAIVSPAIAAAKTWTQVAEDTSGFLQQAVDTYDPQAPDAAKALVDKAYFGPFEADGMEATIKNYISAQRAFELEQEFKQIKIAMKAGKPSEEISSRVAVLSADLGKDAAVLDGEAPSEGGTAAGSATPFVQSFGILLREGFEAILILGAIIAYLRKSENVRGVRTVQIGAVAALAASVVMALALSSVFANMRGFGQEVLEGSTMLIAMVVLFWVSFWLAAKARAKKWHEYIQDAVDRTASKGSTLALASVAFLAVFREGGETILFYTALISGSPGQLGPIAAGFAVAVVALVVLYVALRWGSLHIPFRPFFIATSALLFYMAFVFAGQGIRELQEAGVVGASIVPGIPVVDVFGIYPTAQSLLMQAVLVLTAVGVAIWQGLSGRRNGSQELREAGGTS